VKLEQTDRDIKVRGVEPDVWRSVKADAMELAIPLGQIVTEALRDWLAEKSPRARGITKANNPQRPPTKQEQMLPLLQEMRAKGMSYNAISKATGIWPSQVALWLGKRKRPGEEVIVYLDLNEYNTLVSAAYANGLTPAREADRAGWSLIEQYLKRIAAGLASRKEP
jgi:transcriptional regulator with XRE-family HTH domain